MLAATFTVGVGQRNSRAHFSDISRRMKIVAFIKCCAGFRANNFATVVLPLPATPMKINTNGALDHKDWTYKINKWAKLIGDSSFAQPEE